MGISVTGDSITVWQVETGEQIADITWTSRTGANVLFFPMWTVPCRR